MIDEFETYLDTEATKLYGRTLCEAVKAGYKAICESGELLGNTGFSDKVHQCVLNLKNMIPDYYKATLEQRLANGKGSVTDFTSVDEMEQALLSAEWEPYSHPTIGEGCWGAITHSFGGHEGMAVLSELPPDTPITLDDCKNTGFLSAVVHDVPRTDVDFTVMILGKEGDTDVMFTFHPGEPVSKSTFANGADGYASGTVITASEAMNLGFNKAKVE